jgi:hypothetical protein
LRRPAGGLESVSQQLLCWVDAMKERASAPVLRA